MEPYASGGAPVVFWGHWAKIFGRLLHQEEAYSTTIWKVEKSEDQFSEGWIIIMHDEEAFLDVYGFFLFFPVFPVPLPFQSWRRQCICRGDAVWRNLCAFARNIYITQTRWWLYGSDLRAVSRVVCVKICFKFEMVSDREFFVGKFPH